MEVTAHGITTILTKKDEIEKECGKTFKERFQRANSSDFNNGPLKEDVGHLSDTTAARAVLEGHYMPPSKASEHVIGILSQITQIAVSVPRRTLRELISKGTYSEICR